MHMFKRKWGEDGYDLTHYQYRPKMRGLTDHVSGLSAKVAMSCTRWRLQPLLVDRVPGCKQVHSANDFFITTKGDGYCIKL